MLRPGQPMSLYHEEAAHEALLVLAGTCVLQVDGEERPLRAWDFFHCPAGTAHTIVGAGDAPAVVLAAGARDGSDALRYPASELAARHGASARAETTDPDDAQAGLGEWGAGWQRLPWA